MIVSFHHLTSCLERHDESTDSWNISHVGYHHLTKKVIGEYVHQDSLSILASTNGHGTFLPNPNHDLIYTEQHILDSRQNSTHPRRTHCLNYHADFHLLSLIVACLATLGSSAPIEPSTISNPGIMSTCSGYNYEDCTETTFMPYKCCKSTQPPPSPLADHVNAVAPESPITNIKSASPELGFVCALYGYVT